MRGGVLVGLPPERKAMPAPLRGRKISTAEWFFPHLFDGGLLRTFLAGDRHVRFQDHAFQCDALNRTLKVLLSTRMLTS